MGDQPYYETHWYDEPVTCCSHCHFVQFDGEAPNHAGWCERQTEPSQPKPAAHEMRDAGAAMLPGFDDVPTLKGYPS